MKTIFLAAMATLVAIPAAAATAPVVIYQSMPDRVTQSAEANTAERIEIAAQAACEAPFLRDLKGQQLHAECLAEARAAAKAALAQTELAAR